MSKLDRRRIQELIGHQLHTGLWEGNFGLEKENIRVNVNGELALTPHPRAFGHRQENPFIQTDFSESQLEMITPVTESVEEAYRWMESIHDIVTLELLNQDEYLWPSSNPPILPDEDQIPIAVMWSTEEDRYRQALAGRYSRKRQLLSGVHVNYSLRDAYILQLYTLLAGDQDYQSFKNNVYLKIARRLLKYRWLLVYLTAASPVFDKTYLDRCVSNSDHMNEGSHYFSNMYSLRNSVCGYRNRSNMLVSYDHVASYVRDMQRLIASGELLSDREYYSAVRIKADRKDQVFDRLLDNGISYLELRMPDLNPLFRSGISIDTLRLLHLFLIYSYLSVDEPYGEEDQKIAAINLDNLLKNGIYGRLEGETQHQTFQDEAMAILHDLGEMLAMIGTDRSEYRWILDQELQRVQQPSLTLAAQVRSGIQQSNYVRYHMDKARQYASMSSESSFSFIGYEDLELSTQLLLKASIKRGIRFEVLDRMENFVLLSKGNHQEYVKQANKTSLDSYSTVLIMENKLVTKKVLDRAGIRVPEGRSYESLEEAIGDYDDFKGRPIVVKPKSTNFGLGITIFTHGYTKMEYLRACEMAFEHGRTVLVEHLLSGKEYRFLVMGDDVVGVLHRVPANVIGDGMHTITELVAMKNEDPLRGKGYRTPLERIELGEAERMFLRSQGRHQADIPPAGERIYLRENSNISTGGDSIDHTDDVHVSYKQIAVEAAKAAGATFCGVDMMIDDISMERTSMNYGVIEINFNPAIHIHCYPYQGKNRKADDKILDLLFGPLV